MARKFFVGGNFKMYLHYPLDEKQAPPDLDT